jgi:RNA polymerase sigma factor (sigma-70 family)
VSFQNSPVDAGYDQIRKAQQGDSEALAALWEQCHPSLLNILLARGASRIETEDILADIWSDCVAGAGDKSSLLTKFGGNFSLLSWLARVACNRWIDLKRRGVKQTAMEEADIDAMPGCQTVLEDDRLLELLRESLRSAFARCPDEPLIMLRLVYVHGLTQREVGRMFGWGESKMSRALSEAMEQIKTRTLEDLRRRDQRLELAWEDFLGLCAGEGADFL